MEKNLIDWINRISERRDELGDFAICPFAKKALEDKKIYWSYINFNAVPHIKEFVEKTDPNFEIIAFFNVENNLTDDDLLLIIKELQKNDSKNIYLKDHPDNPGFINRVNTSNGKYPVVLVQPKQKLLDARNKLKKTNYYSYWSEDYKTEIWSYGNES